MRKLVFIFSIIFISCSISNIYGQSDRWSLMHSDSNSKIYLDSESILFDNINSVYDVWIKSYSNDGCCVQTFHQKFYCGKRKYDILTNSIVNENNKTLTLEPSYNLDIHPESFDETIYKFLCTK